MSFLIFLFCTFRCLSDKAIALACCRSYLVSGLSRQVVQVLSASIGIQISDQEELNPKLIVVRF